MYTVVDENFQLPLSPTPHLHPGNYEILDLFTGFILYLVLLFDILYVDKYVYEKKRNITVNEKAKTIQPKITLFQ